MLTFRIPLGTIALTFCLFVFFHKKNQTPVIKIPLLNKNINCKLYQLSIISNFIFPFYDYWIQNRDQQLEAPGPNLAAAPPPTANPRVSEVHEEIGNWGKRTYQQATLRPMS